YHYEYDDEWLIVLEGRPTVRHPGGEEELDPGDIVCFPPRARRRAQGHQPNRCPGEDVDGLDPPDARGGGLSGQRQDRRVHRGEARRPDGPALERRRLLGRRALTGSL